VVLVPTASAYSAALVREYRISPAEAGRRARTTSGWSDGLVIIINIERLSSSLGRFSLAAHELTHQYQIQVTAPADAWGLYWYAEGMADWVGWNVAEVAKVATVDDQRSLWLGRLRQAQALPRLATLDTRTKWSAALEVYGTPNTYRVAALAVDHLVSTGGMETTLTYLRLLRESGDRVQAFRRVFGMTADEYSDEFRSRLDGLLQ
jgi:hypothetical protein